MATIQRVITCFWCEGGYYFETAPAIRYDTKAAMFRKADEMGFTHVQVLHGRYEAAPRSFIVNYNIDSDKRRVPKKYRKET